MALGLSSAVAFVDRDLYYHAILFQKEKVALMLIERRRSMSVVRGRLSVVWNGAPNQELTMTFGTSSFICPLEVVFDSLLPFTAELAIL